MDIFTASAVFIKQKHPGQDKKTTFYYHGGNCYYFDVVKSGIEINSAMKG